MTKQEKYNNFIKGILPNEIKAQLDWVRKLEEETSRVHTIFGGPLVHKTAKIIKLIGYSRSFEVKFEWEDKESSVLIYCPLTKSPKEILEDLNFKVTKEVNKNYTDKELIAIEAKAKSGFKNLFKK